MIRGWRRWVMGLAVAGSFATFVVPSAHASTGVVKSWFYRAQQSGSPSIAAASGVSAGEYAIGFSGAYSVARTVLAVPVGTATSASLVLPVDPTTSSSPASSSILGCPSDSGWKVEEGGAWSDQPLFSCGPTTTAKYDAQNNVITVPLDPLLPDAKDGVLQVMLTPADDPQPNTNVAPTPGNTTGTSWTVAVKGSGISVVFPAAASSSGFGAGQYTGSGSSVTTPSGPSYVQAPAPAFSAPSTATSPAAPSAGPPVVASSPGQAASLPATPVARSTRNWWNPSRWPIALMVFVAVGGTAVARRSGGIGFGVARAAIAARDDTVPAVEVRHLVVRFGGIEAVRDVGFEVPQGQIVGLIGPNGAGKTTVLDAITGLVDATGEVRLLGGDVTRLDTSRRAELGLGRSFQDGRLFPSLTVRECLSVAFEQSQRKVGTLSGVLGAGLSAQNEREVAARVDELLDLMGLRQFEDKFASELSTGSRRIVDLAAMVAHGARVLLLDEPSSGIAQRETEALGPLLRRLRDRLDCTILLVEHDMPLISALADRLIAFEVGAIISDGPPDQVLHDPLVVEAYLGTDLAAVNRSGAATASRRRGRAKAVTA